MLAAAGAELEQLRMQVARLRRMAFGRSSEKLTREAVQPKVPAMRSIVEKAVEGHVRRSFFDVQPQPARALPARRWTT